MKLRIPIAAEILAYLWCHTLESVTAAEQMEKTQPRLRSGSRLTFKRRAKIRLCSWVHGIKAH